MDSILFWNQVALEANRISHTNGRNEQTGPTRSSRALAIVHLAMYDAFAAIRNDPPNFPTYIPSLTPPGPGATVEAAIASAAHRTLSELFPGQKLYFDIIFSGVGAPANSGHVFGIQVADAILADRNMDPGGESPGFVPSPLRGRHRPDPDNPGQGFHGAFYGRSKGFAVTNRFEIAKPPFENAEYRKALREVKGKGIAPEIMGTLPAAGIGRTYDETLAGLFWAYDGVAELGTPPRLYNQIIRRIARKQANTIGQNARLFAFVNAAMADAGILCWREKYRHDFWRPVVGIREHDLSMGPGSTNPNNNIDNDCDTQWLPLGGPRSNAIGKNFTPPFPAYPSGHATFGAAAFHMTRLFYNQGGKLSTDTLGPDTLFQNLDFVSDELNRVTTDNKGTVRPRHLRQFPDGLWQMIEENGRSRVYLGVHWVFDAFAVKTNNTPDITKKIGGKYIGGVPLGLQIAEDIFAAGNGKAPAKSTIGPSV